MMLSTRRLTAADVKLYAYVVLSNTLLHQGIFILFLLYRGFSAFQISLLQALLFVSVSVASVPVGMVVDRIGARASAAGGQLVVSAVLFGQAFGPASFGLYLVLFFAHGVGLTFRDNSELIILYETAAQSGGDASVRFPVLRSRCTALRAATIAVAIIIGGFVQPLSWTLVYVLSGIATLGAAVLAPILLPTTRRSEVTEVAETSEGRAPSRWQAIRRLGLAWGLLLVISSLMHGTLTPFLIFSQDILDSQHVSTQAIAVTMAGVYVLGVVAPLLAPRAMARYSTVMMAALTLVVLAVGLLLASSGVGALTIAVVLVAASVPEVTAIALDFAIQDRMPKEYRGVGTGVVSFLESSMIALAYLGFGALSGLVGASGSAGYFAAVPLTALLVLVGVRVLRPGVVDLLGHRTEPADGPLGQSP